MSTKRERRQKLIDAYAAVAAFTAPKCAGVGLGACRVAHACCAPEYCEMALEEAKRRKVKLETTDHPRLPLMGPNGCTAPAWLRPTCAVHVCERAYTADPEFARAYFALRDRISELDPRLTDDRVDV